MRAAIIHLPGRPDRRANVGLIAARVGVPTQLIDAVDGDTHTAPAGWYASPHAWGNARSHLHALLAAPHPAGTLVFEDDAAVPFGFAERLAELLARLPADWQAVMLGGEHYDPPEPLAPGVVRCRRAVRTHAYLVRDAGYRVALRCARVAAGHWDFLLSQELGRLGHTYAPDPWLVGTTGSPSSIPDSIPIG